MIKELWLQLENAEALQKRESELYAILGSARGCIPVVVYLKKERSIKRLPANRNTSDCKKVIDDLKEMLGEENVKVVEKQNDSFYEDVVLQKEVGAIERIADALENIAQELESMNVHLASLDDLSECIDNSRYLGPRFCITGSLSTYVE